MTNDKGHKIYRKLLYYFENKLPVHFKLELNNDFRNGYIIDLNEEKLTLVLNEFVMGSIPFLLEDIKEGSISEYQGKNEDREVRK